jgi:hypothetical protein
MRELSLGRARWKKHTRAQYIKTNRARARGIESSYLGLAPGESGHFAKSPQRPSIISIAGALAN